MNKCPICRKEFEKRNSLHGHMLRSHLEEYRKNDCRLENFGFGPAIRKRELERPPARPAAGIRLLNLSDPAENAAYKAGYRYICGDDLFYTFEEAREGATV